MHPLEQLLEELSSTSKEFNETFDSLTEEELDAVGDKIESLLLTAGHLSTIAEFVINKIKE